MFCGKCGSQIPDNAVFCPNCGATIGQQPNNSSLNQAAPSQTSRPVNAPGASFTANEQAPYNTSGSYKKPLNKMLFIIIGAAAAALVIILLCVFLGGKGSMGSPEQTIDKLEKALNNLNINEIMDCFDEEIQKEYAAYSDYLDYDISGLADSFGLDIKFDLTVTDKEYYKEGVNEYCEIGVDCQVSAGIFGVTNTDNEKIYLTLVKEKGKWAIYSGYDEIEDLFEMIY